MRPGIDEYFLNIAKVVATRSTCPRRMVGAVAVDGRSRILATGYNGRPAGQPHCTEQPCPGAAVPSGITSGLCEAVHAETNCLLSCHDVQQIHRIYVTCSPCLECTKMLLNTGCEYIIFDEEYHRDRPKEMWVKAGRSWVNWNK